MLNQPILLSDYPDLKKNDLDNILKIIDNDL